MGRLILLDIENFSLLPEYFIQHYHTHLVCLRGTVAFNFNGQLFLCKPGDFFFWFSNARVSDVRFSKNFKGKILLVEEHFLNDNIPDQSWSINASLYSREHPKKTITREEQKRIITNFEQLYSRYTETAHEFYEEIMNLQMQIFVLEMWNVFSRVYDRRKLSLQTGSIYEQFIQLVSLHCATQRKVQFYASELNITPKYLNAVCKNASGVTASGWIERHSREKIIILLENRSLNISEIADKMEFSSRSFFTRYVKKLVGMTPKEYRERM